MVYRGLSSPSPGKLQHKWIQMEEITLDKPVAYVCCVDIAMAYYGILGFIPPRHPQIRPTHQNLGKLLVLAGFLLQGFPIWDDHATYIMLFAGSY